MTRLVGGAWQIQESALLGFLSGKRWFGDKGRTLRGAVVSDVVPIRWPGSNKEFAVARVEVQTDEGASTYQLFVLQGEKPADALDDPEFRRGLVDAFTKGTTFENEGTRWIVESEGAKPLVVPAAAEIKLSTAEQTNSSVFVDAEAILKLYRKLERGVNPDVEVTRFLTACRFVHVPVLLGTIRFEDAKGVTTAGMLQELVPAAVDGWTYALDNARAYARDRTRKKGEAEFAFAPDAEQLGTVTRAMHDALASGKQGSDFEHRQATHDDVRRWASSATRTIQTAAGALQRALDADSMPKDVVAEARAIATSAPDIVRRVAALVDVIGSDAGGNTRTHGDYHLGQVLRSATGQFLVIDFEGEPTRPLEERRARHSPLRDVAGMRRSFSYAAAMAGKGKRDFDQDSRTASPLSLWDQHAREAFTTAYVGATDARRDLLPRSRENAERLIALFEAEKAFYELQYELDHRPDWLWVPLRGIAGLRL